ncbi:hypothetical protein SAMD00019534_038360 [Acytostelium subglobosum LB1]|uniref:hypothetical protein n=1 Tax=Acytostelium subglobosum LB1 TaxID=1410327 RepID=UPI000644F780|nr:hypothetical protein SAMD00019534_038360 [Acytostelium subglobosum LB1]GAM20661.1 hypothetical protein SAMD00019534_038360 [Acytostelium subglobosum LB1]|eukprot:XP_012760182.1 hypothetical protein SAMD00019534_038360 [Acytostelium subglobosum LB1]
MLLGTIYEHSKGLNEHRDSPSVLVRHPTGDTEPMCSTCATIAGAVLSENLLHLLVLETPVWIFSLISLSLSATGESW